jgi:hypothetical protein
MTTYTILVHDLGDTRVYDNFTNLEEASRALALIEERNYQVYCELYKTDENGDELIE